MNINLTEEQRTQLQPLYDSVIASATFDGPGTIVAQVFTTHMSVNFIPHEKSLLLQKIFNPKTVGKTTFDGLT